MNKRIKNLSVIVAMLAILSIVGSFSAFAAIDYTEDWYMNSSLMRGYSTLVDTGVTSGTYCANSSYEKRVEMIYRLYISDGSVNKFEFDSGYYDNNYTTYSKTINEGSVDEDIFEITGIHWVKAAAHMYWCSDDCEDNSYVSRYS